MVRKLASKQTKEIMSEPEIREKGLKKSDFTTSWQGRLAILSTEKSEIAKKLEIEKEAEYAIKVR